MSTDRETILVCGTVRGPLAGEAICARCYAAIYPSLGTLERALREKIPMVCVDCFEKFKNVEFGGVMHHGEMVNPDAAIAIFLELAAEMEEKRKRKTDVEKTC